MRRATQPAGPPLRHGMAPPATQSTLTPHTSNLTPHTSNLTPHTSHLTPHTSHLTPHTPHVTLVKTHNKLATSACAFAKQKYSPQQTETCNTYNIFHLIPPIGDKFRGKNDNFSPFTRWTACRRHGQRYVAARKIIRGLNLDY